MKTESVTSQFLDTEQGKNVSVRWTICRVSNNHLSVVFLLEKHRKKSQSRFLFFLFFKTFTKIMAYLLLGASFASQSSRTYSRYLHL